LGIPFVVFDAKSGTSGKPTPKLYVGVSSTASSLYESGDAGATFEPVKKAPTGMMPSHAALDPKGILFLTYGNSPGPNDVTNGAVWKYDPKSKAWTNVTPEKPSDKEKFGYGGLALDWQKPGTVVVTTIDRWGKGDEAFRTTNGGASWKPVWDKSSFDAAGAQYLFYGKEKLGKPHWTGDVDIDPFDSNHATVVSGAGIFGTSELSLADTNKPTRWEFRNRGLEETVVIDLVSPPKGAKLLSGVGDICGFRHDDLDKPPPGGAFQNPTCKTTKSLDVAAANPDMVVRVGDIWGDGAHGGYSLDGGTTFIPFKSEPKNAGKGGEVAVSANGKTIFWSTKGSTPHVSKDRGNTWARAVGLPEAADTQDWVSNNLRPAFDSRDPAKAYVLDSAKGEIYVSEDGGTSFELSMKGLPQLADIDRISARIVPVPGVEGDVWVSTTKDVQRSTDWGRTFAPLGSVDESVALGFGKGRPGSSYPSAYLVGKVKGVYGFFRSDDQGATWVRINDDAHQYGWVSVITGDPRVHGRVYVGSGGRGILYGDPQK
jgi:xyloglucan-specific exo-beta-1,4-glucanase